MRLAIAHGPVATDRPDREAVLECHSEGTEALARPSSEANRRLMVGMALAALAGLERFNASLTQCVHVGRNAGGPAREAIRIAAKSAFGEAGSN